MTICQFAVPETTLPESVPVWLDALVASEKVTRAPLTVPLVIDVPVCGELVVWPPPAQVSVQLLCELPVNVSPLCVMVTAIAVVEQLRPPPIMLLNAIVQLLETSASVVVVVVVAVVGVAAAGGEGERQEEERWAESHRGLTNRDPRL